MDVRQPKTAVVERLVDMNSRNQRPAEGRKNLANAIRVLSIVPALLTGWLPLSVGNAAAVAEVPITVGHTTQLFIDDYLIAGSDNLTKTVHHPERHGQPVLRREKPWETPCLCYPSAIVVDEKIYLYYFVFSQQWVGRGPQPEDFVDMRITCVAFSEDGVRFTRPELPYFTGEDFERTNVVWAFYRNRQVSQVAGVGVVLDRAEADPDKRFKMVWNAGNSNTFGPVTKVEGPSLAFSTDEHYAYYAATASNHGGGRRGRKWWKSDGHVGLVTWKLDRFVSLDGPSEGGTLTTVPVNFSGGRLRLNAATKGAGSVTVELLDNDSQPFEDFGRADPFRGDDLRHVVTFSGRSDVSKLAGKAVRLRFHLANAELYSFTFEP